MRLHKNESGFTLIVGLMAVALIALLIVAIVYGLKAHNKASSILNTKISPTPTVSPKPDQYAGWNTYTVPEANNISFRYPANWTISDDIHDTVTTPYNRFVKILAPNTFNGDYFVLRFYYEPGTSNTLTQSCQAGGVSGNVKSDAISDSGVSLSVLTSSRAVNDGATNIIVTGVSLVDSSKCYVRVPGGVIQLSGGVGDEGVVSITPAQWESRTEPDTFEMIFKSLKF